MKLIYFQGVNCVGVKIELSEIRVYNKQEIFLRFVPLAGSEIYHYSCSHMELGYP